MQVVQLHCFQQKLEWSFIIRVGGLIVYTRVIGPVDHPTCLVCRDKGLLDMVIGSPSEAEASYMSYDSFMA
jgi:hypothetical protein